jgi:hypothetical protein
MRALYLIIIFATFLGIGAVQGQSSNDFGQPERLDISKSVQIYPNPVEDDFLNVRVQHISLEGVKVSLHNIIGNEMKVEKELVDEHTLRIRVKDLATGYYLIGLNDDKQKLKGIYKFLKL